MNHEFFYSHTKHLRLGEKFGFEIPRIKDDIISFDPFRHSKFLKKNGKYMSPAVWDE